MTKIYYLIFLFLPFSSFAQGLERKLTDENRVEEMTFHAPRHINLFTVEPLDKGELHWSIMHTFNTIDNGFRNLWGIDNGANIRFSLEYAVTDRFSVGVGRSSSDQVYDASMRFHLLQQTISNSMPISISLAVIGGVNSADYSFLGDQSPDFVARSSTAVQLMIARKFTENFSAQISPMLAYFPEIQPIFRTDGTDDFYYALGISAKYRVRPRTSLTFQYIPHLNQDLRHNLGLGVDLEAGGHVFQMYVVTSPFLNEMYLLAGGNGVVGEQFRLGFNVNRIFTVSKR